MFTRITVNPEQFGGQPCIRGLRMPVATIISKLAAGMTESDILNDFPELEVEDIREALRFAANAVQERQIPLIVP